MNNRYRLRWTPDEWGGGAYEIVDRESGDVAKVHPVSWVNMGFQREAYATACRDKDRMNEEAGDGE
jgi:hypothetical protein